MLLMDRKAWFISLKMYAAALTALFIAIEGRLDRPYWAMMTVYIVYLPMVGAARAKGMNRILGTLIGGVGIILMLPSLVQTPVLLVLAMSAWLGVFVFLAQCMRGPSGYVFMLAAYTCSFIGFPYIEHPETIFNIVVSRCEEIALGAVVSVLFASLVFPQRIRPAIVGNVNNWLASAATWSQHVLMQDDRAMAARNALAGSLTQFEAFIAFVRRDDPRHVGNTRILEGIFNRLMTLVTTLSSLGDSLATLKDRQGDLPQPLTEVLNALAEFIKTPESREDFDAIKAQIEALDQRSDDFIDEVVLSNIRVRLDELLRLWWDCRQLTDMIRSHQEDARVRPDLRLLVPRFPLSHHFDYRMMLFSAASAAAALGGYCLFWISIGWEAGGNGAMIAAVVSAFFASKDDPLPNMREFMLATLAASGIAGLLVFWLLPWATDFFTLALVLGVFYLPIGLLMARQTTYFFALPFIANVAALLQLGDTYSINQTTFLNSCLGMLIGVIFAMVMTSVFRSVGADWTARRLVRQSWEILAAAAKGSGRENRHAYTARMFDLLAALAPRLAASRSNSGPGAAGDMLNEIRIGLNILQLRQARGRLAESHHGRINDLLKGVADFYQRQHDAGHELVPPDELLEAIEQGARAARNLPEGSARNDVVVGLVGLRRGLYGYRAAIDDTRPST